MNTKDIVRLGVAHGEPMRRAQDFIAQYVLEGGDKTRIEAEVAAIVANPALFAEDPLRKDFAKAIANSPPPPRVTPAKYRQWGQGLEGEAVNQMENACLLPVSVAGALMPDAHVGYGLPIGGVLATENCVIPYAVGVDIACRMKMTVLDIPLRDLEHKQDRLTRAIAAEATTPRTMPVSASLPPSKRIIRSTCRRSAPSAMRIPTSRVRRLTECEMTP